MTLEAIPWVHVDRCPEMPPGEYPVAYRERNGVPAHQRLAYWTGERWHTGDPTSTPILRPPTYVLRPHLGPLPEVPHG